MVICILIIICSVVARLVLYMICNISINLSSPPRQPTKPLQPRSRPMLHQGRPMLPPNQCTNLRDGVKLDKKLTSLTEWYFSICKFQMFPNLTAPIQPSYKPPPPKQTYNSPAPSKAPVYKPEPKPSYSAPQEAPHIIYAGHPPIHIYQQPPVLEQQYQVSREKCPPHWHCMEQCNADLRNVQWQFT